MDLDFTSHRGQWHLVVVEGTAEVCVGGHIWGGVGLAEEIECDFCLREETVGPTGIWGNHGKCLQVR